jgi:hypothetical protein
MGYNSILDFESSLQSQKVSLENSGTPVTELDL